MTIPTAIAKRPRRSLPWRDQTIPNAESDAALMTVSYSQASLHKVGWRGPNIVANANATSPMHAIAKSTRDKISKAAVWVLFGSRAAR